MGVEFPAFNAILYTKSEQKVIGKEFCTTKIFTNPLKNGFSQKNILRVGV